MYLGKCFRQLRLTIHTYILPRDNGDFIPAHSSLRAKRSEARQSRGKYMGLRPTHQIPSLFGGKYSSVIARHAVPRQSTPIGGVAASQKHNKTTLNTPVIARIGNANPRQSRKIKPPPAAIMCGSPRALTRPRDDGMFDRLSANFLFTPRIAAPATQARNDGGMDDF